MLKQAKYSFLVGLTIIASFALIYMAIANHLVFNRMVSILLLFISLLTFFAYFFNINFFRSRNRNGNANVRIPLRAKKTSNNLQGNENFKDLQFIQKLYDVSPALITLLDITTGKYLYVNKRAQDILGFSSEEILAGGREMMNSLIHNEDVKQLLQRRSEAIEDANKNFPTYDDSSVVEFEYRVRHKNGNYKWLHNYGSIFSRNAKNKVEQILNISVDITQRKEAEEKLLETKAALRKLNNELEQKVQQRTLELELEKIALRKEVDRNDLVAKATHDVLWDWDLVANTVKWNENYHLLFGTNSSPSDSNVTDWEARLHPDDKDKVLEIVNTGIKEGKSNWTSEYRFRYEDGSYANILDRGYVLRDEQGKAYRVVGCMTDISSSIQAQLQIKKSELKFRKIFDSNMMGMAFSTSDAQIQEANDLFLSMMGYSRDELDEGKLNWNRITAPEFHILASEALEQLNTLGACQPFEKEYIRKDGSRLYAYMGAALVEEGNHSQIITYIIDISPRKEAEKKEQQLRKIIDKQQEEFKSIFMNAPAMISIRRGPELRVEFQNATLLKFMDGVKMIGKTLEETSDFIKGDADSILNVYNTGVAVVGNDLLVKVDRGNGDLEEYWVDYIHQPLFAMDGRVDGVATFGFDVTNLVKANKEIKANEERFRFLANAIPQMLWTAKPDGNVNYYNSVWLDYTNLTFEELRHDGWKKIVHPDDLEQTVKIWESALTNGHDFELEHRMLNNKNEYRWHLVRGLAQKNSNGEITLWVGTNTDIHDQKLFAEALQASEDYFKELANEVPFMIWKVDEQGRANYVNKTWIDFTGLSFNESIGDYWLEALHPEDRVRENITFPEAFKLRKSYHSKFRLKRKDGVYRWVMNQCHPLLNPKFSGYIGSLTDITEQELEQQQTTSLIERMDEFMSIASHELKTPITSMKGYLQIAERITEKDEVKLPVHSYIEKANKQVNKLTYLVEDLLNVTKIQAGKIDFAYSEFKINEVILDCIEQLQQNFHTHEIVTDECVDVKVYADRSRIEQVLVNIISNAVKYSPSANKVIISCTHNSNFIKISVTDFGIGIPHDKIPFIFDRFFRVRESVQTLSGLGLGLYISSEIVKRHDGDIGVLSEEGRGSTVWFTLPTNTWTKENI